MIFTFKGKHEFLSNFYEAPLLFNGRSYRNSEAAYQAQKFIRTFAANDLHTSFETLDAAAAKKKAKARKSEVRKDWLNVSLSIMTEIVHAKFTQNKDLRIQLVNTYPEQLSEGNWWHDQFWGDCSCASKPDCREPGKNWLGRILMAERAFWLDLMVNSDYYDNDRLVEAFKARAAA